MTDLKLEAEARELLAAEYDDWCHTDASLIREGMTNNAWSMAIRAIVAALAQQPAAEPYKALFVAAMNTAEQAMDYVQNNPDKFGARPGDDKLAIVCREFLKAQQPAAVDGATLRQALHAMKRCQRESGGSQWAPWIAKVEAALVPERWEVL